MKFFTVTSFAALVALVQAIEITNSEINPAAGEQYTISWANAEGPVTLTLRRGPSTALETVDVISSGLPAGANGEGSYTWTVPSDLAPGADYAFQIDDSTGVPNYSKQFPLDGTGEATTAASATATATSASASATTVVTVTSSAASSTEASSLTTVTVTSASSSVESSASASASESLSAESSSVSESATSAEASASASASAEPSQVPDSKAGRLASPVALIFTIAAMLYFH